mgnify:CR=1 FL=1|tara:strand:+ start:10588 stop:11454 length:867 start_codon:yes stop_codon:yes gene_type:complete
MLTHEFLAKKKPTRIVILGAGGFIGQVLVRQLTNLKVEVLPLTSSAVDLLDEYATQNLIDLFDSNDCVVMLAALTPDRGRDITTYQKNITMAENVCEALRQKPVAHVVYMSSDAVYSMRTARISEQTLAAPDDLYGLMHRTRELMFQQASSAPVVVLRSTMVAGRGDTHNSYGPNRFHRQAVQQGCISLGGEGEETRDHIFSEDVAALTTLAILHRSSGVLNLATGRSCSFYEVAKMVAERTDQVVEIKTSERGMPVTHRSFDTTATNAAFPGFTFVSLPEMLDKSFG